MRILKRILIGLAAILVAIILGVAVWAKVYLPMVSSRNMKLAGPEATVLEDKGYSFRDLNKNGKLDSYEDPRRAIEERVEDLLSQMTVEEKAGTMFISFIHVNSDGELSEVPFFSEPMSFATPSSSEMVLVKRMNHLNLMMVPAPRQLAAWHNKMQKLAERTRLGIPLTIASDPRNNYSTEGFVASFSGHFSQWPEPLGLAAIGDTALVRRFGDIARQEYRSVGIHVALHPMADLATEPRWPRINGTFGEDATLASEMIHAYIRGFQGESLTSASVACMTKHFSGGGPQKDGLDPHFEFGREQVYPGNNFNYHLIPFEAAFAAGTAQIMPYYGIPMGQTNEDVGFAFNKQIITDLLRIKYKFDGVVCTDWGLLTDKKLMGMTIMKASGWGVGHLTVEEKIVKAIEAGMDQFGGETETEALIRVIREGRVSEERINQSIRRLLRDKFLLGLFDNPYVDEDHAAETVGKAEFVAEAELAHRKAVVLLKKEVNGTPTLPVAGGKKIYVENIDRQVAALYAQVVDSPEDADLAVIRLRTPFQPMPGLIEGIFHHGDLDFKGEEKERIIALLDRIPTIVDLYVDRGAVIPEIAEKASGLIADFGARDEAVLDVIFGRHSPSAKLPIELPSSMEAVGNQLEDVPYDSKNPLFPFGFGLLYDSAKGPNPM